MFVCLRFFFFFIFFSFFSYLEQLMRQSVDSNVDADGNQRHPEMTEAIKIAKSIPYHGSFLAY
jgi:hypothetical protein